MTPLNYILKEHQKRYNEDIQGTSSVAFISTKLGRYKQAFSDLADLGARVAKLGRNQNTSSRHGDFSRESHVDLKPQLSSPVSFRQSFPRGNST